MKKPPFSLLARAILALAIAGGAGAATGSDVTPSPSQNKITATYIINMESQLPAMPDKTESGKTLAGVDANNNGVRDDIEHWIANKYSNSAKMRAIALQHAAATRRAHAATNKADAREYAADVTRSVMCQSITMTHDNAKQLRGELSRESINTPERLRAYLQYEKLLGGGIYRLPDGNDDQARMCDIQESQLPNLPAGILSGP